MESNYYIGQVTAVNNDYNAVSEDGLISRNYHEIRAKIPGFLENIVARPVSGLGDEPKIGDTVLLYCLDPVFHSSFVYQKLKENDFIGIRAAGKMIDITEDSVRISVYDKELEYAENERPGEKDRKGVLKASITLNDDGMIEIYSEKGIKISSGTPIPDSISAEPSDGEDFGTSSGPFNAICKCPYIGVNHSCSSLLDSHN